MRVDSQIHIWAADTPDRPWPKSGADGRTATPQRDEPLGLPEILRQMDAAGVDRAVLVPPSWEGDRNELALAAAAVHPDRFAVMGRLAPDRPDLDAALAGWRSQPGMLGVRVILGDFAWLAADGGDRFWAAAARRGVPVMAAPAGRVPILAAAAARHPDLSLIVDHMGARVHHTYPEAFVDLPAVLALARLPNVAIKASSAPSYSAETYPFRDVHAPLKALFDAFGPQRLFWGSDLSRLPCAYSDLVRMFEEELPWLAGEDRKQVMGAAIVQRLGWTLGA
jgi:L-fuconolactonase